MNHLATRSVLERGEGGIRTHGTVSRSGAFKAPALVHYATSPTPDSGTRQRGEHAEPSRRARAGSVGKSRAAVLSEAGAPLSWTSEQSEGGRQRLTERQPQRAIL